MAQAQIRATAELAADVAHCVSETSRENLHLLNLSLPVLSQDSSQTLEELSLLRKDAADRALDLATFHYELEDRNSTIRHAFERGALKGYEGYAGPFTDNLRTVSEKSLVLSNKLEALAVRSFGVERGIHVELARRNLVNISQPAGHNQGTTRSCGPGSTLSASGPKTAHVHDDGCQVDYDKPEKR
ncbi:MAG: hypothetical protein Q9169_007576 [Polycauliona sp. 2 TL-2023]